MGPRNHVLDGGKDRIRSAARGEKSAMRPFAKLLWTLVCHFFPPSLKLRPYGRIEISILLLLILLLLRIR